MTTHCGILRGMTRTTADMTKGDLRTIEFSARKWGMFIGDKNSFYDFYRTKGGIGVDGLGGLQFFSNPVKRAEDFCLLDVHIVHGLYFSKHCEAILDSGRRSRNIMSAL